MREREREYYCHLQDVHIVADTKKVWIHSSLEVKPKQNWTPWYTEMASPASHTNPASESEPALLIKFNPFSQSLELFGEGSALEWVDSLQGVQAVSVGWLTLRGLHSRGRFHTKVCSEPLQCPCNVPSPSPAMQDYPQLMTACLETEIGSFQPCSTSQG